MRDLGPSESTVFLSELEKFIDIRAWDEISHGLYAYIEGHLEAFPKLGESDIRIAQTSQFIRHGLTIPPLEIWFRIDESNQKLELLGVTLEDDSTLDDDVVW